MYLPNLKKKPETNNFKPQLGYFVAYMTFFEEEKGGVGGVGRGQLIDLKRKYSIKLQNIYDLDSMSTSPSI